MREKILISIGWQKLHCMMLLDIACVHCATASLGILNVCTTEASHRISPGCYIVAENSNGSLHTTERMQNGADWNEIFDGGLFYFLPFKWKNDDPSHEQIRLGCHHPCNMPIYNEHFVIRDHFSQHILDGNGICVYFCVCMCIKEDTKLSSWQTMMFPLCKDINDKNACGLFAVQTKWLWSK